MPSYVPWERTAPSSVMLRLIDDDQGKLIPLASIIEVSFGNPIDQVCITCAERMIRVTGEGLQHLVTALQRGEVDAIRVWEPTDYPDTSVVPSPRVTHIAVVRRGKV